MEKLKLSILLLLISTVGFAQDKSDQYYYTIYRADSALQKGNYDLSLALYNQAEQSEGRCQLLVLGRAYIYGAKQNKDSVLHYLNEAIEKYAFNHYGALNWATYFKFLRKDEDFIAVSDNLKNKIKEKLTAEGKNVEVTMRLLEASIRDQIVRQQLHDSELSKTERKALLKKAVQNDIENQALLSKIIDQYGLPTKDWVSGFAATTSFLIILHADNNSEFQKRGLELIEKAVNEGKMKKGYYVKLKKRISL